LHSKNTEGIEALIAQLEELLKLITRWLLCDEARLALQAWLQEDNPRTLTALHTQLFLFTTHWNLLQMKKYPSAQPPVATASAEFQELSISARIS